MRLPDLGEGGLAVMGACTAGDFVVEAGDETGEGEGESESRGEGEGEGEGEEGVGAAGSTGERGLKPTTGEEGEAEGVLAGDEPVGGLTGPK